MTTYYNILDTIKNQLLQDDFCNSVTEGSIWEIDLSKQTIAPYSHIQVNNATINERTNVFNISVFCMDIVDKNPALTTDKFRGNDNEQDVLNTQYAVATRLLELMRRGDLRSNNFALLEGSTPLLESFTERFENFWAGWTVSFDVEVPNEMTICDNVIPATDCADATYLIKDLDGNTLYNGSIASGGSTTQTINDSTAILKNTLGTTISTTEILAEGSEEITAPNALVGLEDTNGNVIGGDSYPSGTANTMVAPDGSVENSDLSYTNTVLSGGTLVLPDVTNTDSDGSPVVTPAQTSFVCTPAASSVQSATLLKSGLTVSYALNDDGDLQAGRSVDFFTLPENNPFGNTNRFTDELGTQTYTNDIIIDWSTYNTSTVLGYYRVMGGTNTWSDSVLNASNVSTGAFTSGWRLTNVVEFNNLHLYGSGRPMIWSPLNQPNLNLRYWTSTTLHNYTNQPYYGSNFFGSGGVVGTQLYNWIACRDFTLAELGL